MSFGGSLPQWCLRKSLRLRSRFHLSRHQPQTSLRLSRRIDWRSISGLLQGGLHGGRGMSWNARLRQRTVQTCLLAGHLRKRGHLSRNQPQTYLRMSTRNERQSQRRLQSYWLHQLEGLPHRSSLFQRRLYRSLLHAGRLRRRSGM